MDSLDPQDLQRLLESAPAERDLQADARLQPGSTLGPYVIERFLGRGAMGLVLQARDPRVGRSVALKIPLLDEQRETSQRLRRLVIEGRAVRL